MCLSNAGAKPMRKRLHVSDQPAYRPGMASNFLESMLDNSQNQIGSHQKQDGTFKHVQDEFPITVLHFQWVQVDFLGGSPLVSNLKFATWNITIFNIGKCAIYNNCEISYTWTFQKNKKMVRVINYKNCGATQHFDLYKRRVLGKFFGM
jgi:hypothetical protein